MTEQSAAEKVAAAYDTIRTNRTDTDGRALGDIDPADANEHVRALLDQEAWNELQSVPNRVNGRFAVARALSGLVVAHVRGNATNNHLFAVLDALGTFVDHRIDQAANRIVDLALGKLQTPE